jgi:sorbitol-specific phosphotransferase system component IIC
LLLLLLLLLALVALVALVVRVRVHDSAVIRGRPRVGRYKVLVVLFGCRSHLSELSR